MRLTAAPATAGITVTPIVMFPPAAGSPPRPHPEMLAFRLRIYVPCAMDNVIRLPGRGLAEFQRSHPEISYCQVEGTWRAWIEMSGRRGWEAHGHTEDELLAKLTAALGG